MMFACPKCRTMYRVQRKSEPSAREPHCEECGAELPDNEGDEWLHYQRSKPAPPAAET
jgi:DNA replicative helicase MCM subunit Mcm2 (Cdc46/Mcm family)